MATISNHRVGQTDRVRQSPLRDPLRANRVGHSPLRANRVGHSPLREHSAKTVSEDAWQVLPLPIQNSKSTIQNFHPLLPQERRRSLPAALPM
jgi:hypothetical protein